MAHERKTISVKHILFDDINPRHDPSEGQKEALQKLISVYQFRFETVVPVFYRKD